MEKKQMLEALIQNDPLNGCHSQELIDSTYLKSINNLNN